MFPFDQITAVATRLSTVRIVEIDDPTADTDNLQVGEDVVYLAPSGRVYAGLITAKEFFASEWNVYISDVQFTANGKTIEQGGWLPVSHVRRYADWLADYLDGAVSL